MATTSPINTVTQQGISPYVSGYATDMLGRAKAVSETPYTPYAGNRVAGFDPLQEKAFQGVASLAGYDSPTYTSSSFTDPGMMQQFMTPYQQGVTDIAMREARRASDIAGQAENAAAAQKGAFGGARHAIMGAERARGLQQQLGDIQTKGLQSAYDAAQKQFNVEQQQGQQRQYLQDLADRYGYSSGVDALNRQLLAGREKQALEQKGLDIDYDVFKEERNYPRESLNFARDMLRGLPMTTTSVTGQMPGIDWLSTLGGVAGLLGKNPDFVSNLFKNFGGSAGGIKDLFGGSSGSVGAGGGDIPGAVYGGGYAMPDSSEITDYLSSIFKS